MILLTLLALAVTAVAFVGLYFGLRRQWANESDTPQQYRATAVEALDTANRDAVRSGRIDDIQFFTAPRGYSCSEVDDYLASASSASAQQLKLGVSAGGYRMDQVDRVIAEIIEERAR